MCVCVCVEVRAYCFTWLTLLCLNLSDPEILNGIIQPVLADPEANNGSSCVQDSQQFYQQSHNSKNNLDQLHDDNANTHTQSQVLTKYAAEFYYSNYNYEEKMKNYLRWMGSEYRQKLAKTGRHIGPKMHF